MSSYLIDIFMSFASMFLTCYFIYWIVGLFKLKNPSKVAFIVITIDVILHLLVPIEGIINYTNHIGDQIKVDHTITKEDVIATYAQYAVWIIVDLSAYFLFVYLYFGNVVVFKSQRARQFERTYNGKSNLIVHITRALMCVLSGLCIGGAILLFIMSHLVYVVVLCIFLLLIAALMIFLVVKSFMASKGSVKTKTSQDKISNYYFIIITKFETYLFEGDGTKSFKEAINGLDDIYYIDEYGIINDGTKKLVYGIRLDDISENYLSRILMNRIYNERLVNILSTLDKINQKVITVDSDYNIIDEKKR